MKGVSGEIEVNGKTYNSVMPHLNYLSDDNVAAILTYVLNAWGNPGGTITTAQVAERPRGYRSDSRRWKAAHIRVKARVSKWPTRVHLHRSVTETTATMVTTEGPSMTEEEFSHATKLYFERCAGCHGVLRKGATGKPLTTDITREKGTQYLETMINYGSPAGMPNWGTSGEFTAAEISELARFLQHPPPEPPEFGLPQITESWNLLVPESKRPNKPQHKYDVEDMFSVTLRDSGEVAIIDGPSKKILNIIKTGYAVHISRTFRVGTLCVHHRP